MRYLNDLTLIAIFFGALFLFNYLVRRKVYNDNTRALMRLMLFLMGGSAILMIMVGIASTIEIYHL